MTDKLTEMEKVLWDKEHNFDFSILPNFVRQRADFFAKQMADGLSYFGALEATMAYEEAESKKEIEMGGSWLPVSDEFKNWRDGFLGYGMKQMIVALYMIYGIPNETEKEASQNEKI